MQLNSRASFFALKALLTLTYFGIITLAYRIDNSFFFTFNTSYYDCISYQENEPSERWLAPMLVIHGININDIAHS